MSNTDEIDHAKSSTFHENDVAPSTGDSNASKTTAIDSSSTEHGSDKVIVDPAISSKPKGWVQFEDEDDNKRPKGDKIPKMENVDLSADKVNFYSNIYFVICIVLCTTVEWWKILHNSLGRYFVLSYVC